jgi:hypothetical protein
MADIGSGSGAVRAPIQAGNKREYAENRGSIFGVVSAAGREVTAEARPSTNSDVVSLSNHGGCAVKSS